MEFLFVIYGLFLGLTIAGVVVALAKLSVVWYALRKGFDVIDRLMDEYMPKK